jgi:hypothetical protein
MKFVIENCEMAYNNYLHEIIIKIWNEKLFRILFEKYKYKYHISDGATLLLNKATKIKKIEKYKMEESDILLLRIKTIGFLSLNLKYRNVPITIFDFGGQRNERKVINDH